ncbi:dTDP-4-amino-4,6-dideoxygalactose transaminase [Flavobacteriaceae bacterium MAR_2010_72]|nr:dTDP-4-amino-4,6-dideoxygalactose transaminase [Flavobacteriaceae bacterium MAR_2010_72]TVZ59634.1 dTDP-4-amino-4,6-dideoxygalactose transaminase [Flavobacteriaceae bacterium MAR_2010_105]
MQNKENKRIWLSPPHMSGNEQAFVNQAFESNWIAPNGEHINGFEQELTNYLNPNYFVTVLNSGTSAIHLSLLLLGVTDGDEVLCQSNTFIASVNPVCYCGATPIFIDSEADSWNICPEQLELAIKDRIKLGKKPKAIIAVHLYGMPYNVNAIQSIAESYDIPVIEDSAEALGSRYKTEKCGTLGTLSAISFNGNKIITTSAGGALITKDKELKQKAVLLANQAKEYTTEYLHNHIGYNYRMSNVLAGIGRGQLQVIEKRVEARRAIYSLYKEQLSSIEEVGFQSEADNSYSNRWLTCILLPKSSDKEPLRVLLEQHNIESKPLWKPMHQQPVFKNSMSYINGISDMLFNKGLCLPSGSDLTEEDQFRVISIIKDYFSS